MFQFQSRNKWKLKKKKVSVSLFKVASASWNRTTTLRMETGCLRKKLFYSDCNQYQSDPNMLGLSALVSPSWDALSR